MRTSKIIAAAAVVVFGLGVAACDKTVRGVGQDMRDTGNAVEGAAR
ncbi:entericidin A/B family lipoprotein [Methylobrevis pamukkalensis]|uniref:Entericidin B membrane lipoprotein n=1 Tax=Methylobrevis pamukkalensis TaxID=1439726 RepID=A0A1E3H0L9_9HYPH|nr:entericidin A/B family lipoprotein [Methylobrevis pamukkalensis]ODN69857.1 entericidin B membrane lipoprotein [Methylobrevis pamukkalensis]